MSRRFQAPQTSIYPFNDEVFVECPHCGGCARTWQVGEGTPGWFAARRLVCLGCPFTSAWRGDSIGRGWRQARDDYFELPLWLRTPCCGEVLWAYNGRHLDLLEAFVAARLRERSKDPEWGWANGSLVSRLPRWIQQARHRQEVLQAIERLRQRLPSPASG